MIARLHRRRCGRCGRIYIEDVSPTDWADHMFRRSTGRCPSCKMRNIGTGTVAVGKVMLNAIQKKR